MKRTTVLVLAIAVTVTMLPAGSAGASHYPHTKCSSSGDYCVSVKKIDGVRRLRLAMLFKYFRRHEVCVKGPEDVKTCHTYRTRRLASGLWGSSIDWRANYPFQGDGRYRVSWRTRSGPLTALKFHVH